ncbi:MAG: hypothetical protein HY067_11895 [Betaproteobacteria bacterium]|nr:hypothetical protein [Betaproteobacteria bacterium]
MRSRIFFPLLLATPTFNTDAGDTGYAPKAIDLLDRPAADGKPVAKLAKQQPVEVVSRSEFDKLKRFSVAARDASGFARSAGLKPRKQDYLEDSDYLSMDQLPDDFFDE